MLLSGRLKSVNMWSYQHYNPQSMISSDALAKTAV